MWTILSFQKNGSTLGYFGLGSAVSNLQRPIGGPHPGLYFQIQVTVKYSTAMCYRRLRQPRLIAKVWFPNQMGGELHRTLRVCSFTNFKFDERDIYMLWTLHATEATLGLMERGHWGVWYFATMDGKRFDSLCALLSHEQQRQWQARSFIMGRPLTDPILWGTDIAFDHTLSELWCFHDVKVYHFYIYYMMILDGHKPLDISCVSLQWSNRILP